MMGGGFVKAGSEIIRDCGLNEYKTVKSVAVIETSY
jgi:hypothetical protein